MSKYILQDKYFIVNHKGDILVGDYQELLKFSYEYDLTLDDIADFMIANKNIYKIQSVNYFKIDNSGYNLLIDCLDDRDNKNKRNKFLTWMIDRKINIDTIKLFNFALKYFSNGEIIELLNKTIKH